MKQLFGHALVWMGAPVLSPLRAAVQQPLELASPFVDNAILQCGMPVQVWG